MRTIFLAAKILWEIIGKKLFLLPLMATAGIIWLGDVFEVVDVSTISLKWLLAPAILIFWIIAGLFVKVVSLQRRLDMDLKPDISAREAFRHLMLEAKWSIGKNPDDNEFYPEIEGELRDAARLGHLKVWARPRPKFGGGGGFKETLTEITLERWDDVHFDLPSCAASAGESACLTDYSVQEWTTLEDAKVNKNQLIANWPKASFLEKWMDNKYKKRQEFSEKEQRAYGPR